MHIGLIVRGGVEEGTEDRNPFPVFVDFIRRLTGAHKVQIFSIHGENKVRLSALPKRYAPAHRFAGADVFQLGTVRVPRFRVLADVVRTLAVLLSDSNPS